MDEMSELFTALSALVDAKPRRRRRTSGPRATSSEFDDAVYKACVHECAKTKTPDGYTVAARYDGYHPAPARPVRLTVTYGRPVLVRVTHRPDPGQPERSRRVSYAAAIAFLAELTAAIAQDRRETTDADSCFCFAVKMPPCSWCERQVWCEECGGFVTEDDLDEHNDAKHPDIAAKGH